MSEQPDESSPCPPILPLLDPSVILSTYIYTATEKSYVTHILRNLKFHLMLFL